jgi:hypothetical protein
MSTTEELLGRKITAPVYKPENTAVGISHADHVALFNPQNLALTSLASGCRSVDIVRSRTQATESFSILSLLSVKCIALSSLSAIHQIGLHEAVVWMQMTVANCDRCGLGNKCLCGERVGMKTGERFFALTEIELGAMWKAI